MKTLSHRNLVVGKTYLNLGVDTSGALRLNRITIRSRPDKDGSLHLDTIMGCVPGESGPEYKEMNKTGYLEGMGCPVGTRKYIDNFHRVFKNTSANRAALRQFVAKQDLHSYLIAIGLSRIEAAVWNFKYVTGAK